LWDSKGVGVTIESYGKFAGLKNKLKATFEIEKC
jgi:hypothetical protein